MSDTFINEKRSAIARENKCRQVIEAALKDFKCTIEPEVVFKPNKYPQFLVKITAQDE